MQESRPGYFARAHRRDSRETGVATVFVFLIGMGLIGMTVVSLQMTLSNSAARRTQQLAFLAMETAESGLAQALAELRNGVVEPVSGPALTGTWVNFGSGGGGFFYSTLDDVAGATVHAWGRIPFSDSPSSSAVAPDDPGWDGTGWLVRGLEVVVRKSPYIPPSPVFVGNGGLQRPMGGFEWDAGSDLFDPASWEIVTADPDAYQSASVPCEISALDHPADFLYGGAAPAAAVGPHPYSILISQNAIGQHNAESWFANSAGVGNDPTTKLTPPPTAPFYSVGDPTAADYAYPIRDDLPDVQELAWAMWNQYATAPATARLAAGPQNGTYGDLATPGVTIVTGRLEVDPGATFEGVGVLVIRDDFDPNLDLDNQPATYAQLDVKGTFRWTGLVLLAGWNPLVRVQSGGDAKICGALLAEDSVQTMGEPSLASSSVMWQVESPLSILYSRVMFEPGGIIQPFLPRPPHEFVGIREL